MVHGDSVAKLLNKIVEYTHKLRCNKNIINITFVYCRIVFTMRDNVANAFAFGATNGPPIYAVANTPMAVTVATEGKKCVCASFSCERDTAAMSKGFG